MVTIRRLNADDIENIKAIYEKAFEYREGLLMYYPGFKDYILWCEEHGYAYGRKI